MYIVFGKDYCIYCKLTKQLLDHHHIEYTYYDIDENKAILSDYKDVVPHNFNKIPIIIKINGKKRTFLPEGFSELKMIIEKSNKSNKSKKIKKGAKGAKSKKNNNIEKFCSPGQQTHSGNTCFDNKALINIIKSWNTHNTDNKVIYNKKDSVNSLWVKINNKFKGDCDNELCWMEQSFIDNKKYKQYFRPSIPTEWSSKPREWLSTININHVLTQYDTKYKDFMFIGTVPIDFDDELAPGNCVVNELCKVNINTFFQNNIRRIGIVFNLDKHTEDGSHWVALFCNFKKKEICYFDSYGIAPPTEINTLMLKLKEQATKHNINMKLKYNKVRHQYKNTECGIYCINFIVKLLEGRGFETHCNKIIDDDTMFKNRNVFFV